MTTHVGVVVVERGAAIVTVERDEDDRLLVTGIERLPYNLGIVAERVREVDPDVHVVIDSEGLGTALWGVLGQPDDAEHWTLYAGRGLDAPGYGKSCWNGKEESRTGLELAHVEGAGHVLDHVPSSPLACAVPRARSPGEKQAAPAIGVLTKRADFPI